MTAWVLNLVDAGSKWIGKGAPRSSGMLLVAFAATLILYSIFNLTMSALYFFAVADLEIVRWNWHYMFAILALVIFEYLNFVKRKAKTTGTDRNNSKDFAGTFSYFFIGALAFFFLSLYVASWILPGRS